MNMTSFLVSEEEGLLLGMGELGGGDILHRKSQSNVRTGERTNHTRARLNIKGCNRAQCTDTIFSSFAGQAFDRQCI